MKKFLAIAAMAATLAACGSGEGDAAYGPMQAQEGAEFRFFGREVVGMLNPVCPYSEDPEQMARYDQPRARYEAVKEWVEGKPRAVDLAMVEADFAFYWNNRNTTCGAPDTEETMAGLDRDMQVLDENLTRLENLAGMM